MIIDAHQHVWRIGENDCTWPTPDLSAIHRHFDMKDLAPLAAALGVVGTVLVQSQPSDRDTAFLLRVAEGADLVEAVVGWVELPSSLAPSRIEALAARPKMRGLRPMLQALEADDWILDRRLDPAIATMKSHGLCFDALVRERHLPHLRTFAERHPDLPIVIDHGAKPAIASGVLEPWRSQIAAFEALPNVYCKLSGLLTEAAPGQGTDALKPYAEHLLETFGPDRLMWGSDWPVLELAGHYAGWLEMARELCGTTDRVSLRAIFGETARRFYRI